MIKNPNKPYNLEERTLKFSREIIVFCKKLSKDAINMKLVGQLVDSATSVGADYREANEALSKKDFTHRMKITRKECKESSYWLELLKEANSNLDGEINLFIQETKESGSI